jgi:SAM-dependent methyltransferase
MGFLGSRLDSVREQAVRRLVPFPAKVPKAYWPRVTAFAFSYSMGRALLDIVEELRLSPSSARILIVGAWGGRDYFWLRAHGYDPETLDIVNHPWGETTYLGDACEESTWKRVIGLYDLIVLCDVLEHLPQDFKALCHISQALKPTGRLWLSVPYRLDAESTHVRAYSPGTLKRLLACAGLAVVRTEPRPGSVAAFPRLVNVLNYGLSLAMPTPSLGGVLLAALLRAERRLNRAWSWLNLLGAGSQRGMTCLCAPANETEFVNINRSRFAITDGEPY